MRRHTRYYTQDDANMLFSHETSIDKSVITLVTDPYNFCDMEYIIEHNKHFLAWRHVLGIDLMPNNRRAGRMTNEFHYTLGFRRRSRILK